MKSGTVDNVGKRNSRATFGNNRITGGFFPYDSVTKSHTCNDSDYVFSLWARV